MVASPFAFGSTLNPVQQQPYPQSALPFGGYGLASQQAPIQSAQQILQWLQVLPQQLQQLTYVQQQTLQQLLQVVPAQAQQLQQLVQLVPHVIHQIHQLQHHILAQPLQAFPSIPSSAYAAQPSHVM
jgi:hypothetical protein